LGKTNAMKKYLALAILFLCLSCDDQDDNFPCSGPSVAGLQVLVRNDITDEILTAGVTVVAADQQFEETLVLANDYFLGAYDRQANFILTVTKAGYQTYTSGNIAVYKPGCHSVTTQVTVDLVPE
jgi:hypothetical protein